MAVANFERLQAFKTKEALKKMYGHGVKLDPANAEHVIAVTSATDMIVGVLHEANDNDIVGVLTEIGSKIPVVLGGAVVVGAKLTIDATGAFVTAATGNHVYGLALEAGAKDKFITMLTIAGVAA